ncbi:MAG: sodium:alanine symporter family protein [Leptospiraceae bacterium]|nr:MAG: sodium:alanine symporter family protein [Leptospiraceae bacterium]
MYLTIEKWINQINDVVWGPILLILLFGTHIFLTFRLGFIQRFIGLGIKISIKKEEGKGDISQFAALTTALAATIGTGNIVGVATAISMGGPGALLWMWLTGVFGIATKYSEALLSIKFREIDKKGNIVGGPMFVLEKGLKQKWLGIIFAVLTVIASFGIGNMVQANSISHLLNDQFSIPQQITGIILALLTGLVIIGGIRSIAKVCEILVPFMAFFYIVSLFVIIVLTLNKIPETFYLVFTTAFTGQSAIGGFVGAGVKEAIRAGIARGLFSNESGLGSAPIVAAAAQTKNAVRQALVSATGTFWDTVVICALTGIAIINTDSWKMGLKGAEITNQTFSILGNWGGIILSISLLLFVFSTILGWSYYGEKALEYIAGIKSIMIFRIIWIVFIFIGATTTLNIVWGFSDIANALMAIPNLISLLLLNNFIKKETDKFLSKENIDKEDPELIHLEEFKK